MGHSRCTWDPGMRVYTPSFFLLFLFFFWFFLAALCVYNFLNARLWPIQGAIKISAFCDRVASCINTKLSSVFMAKGNWVIFVSQQFQFTIPLGRHEWVISHVTCHLGALNLRFTTRFERRLSWLCYTDHVLGLITKLIETISQHGRQHSATN